MDDQGRTPHFQASWYLPLERKHTRMISNPLPSLRSGERVLWHGQPNDGFSFRPVELFLIPFSVLWGGFAVFWNVSVWSTDAPLFFKLFGLPFLIIGLYVIFGRFFVESWLRRRMRYAVTNQRIIIQSGGRSTVKSLDINRLSSLELHEKSDCSGTIRFDNSFNWMSAGGFGIWQPSLDSSLRFLDIENVGSVYELIQEQSVR